MPRLESLAISMHPSVTFNAQRDQVLFGIATRLTPGLEVMYLQVLRAAANLASPAVALQHVPV